MREIDRLRSLKLEESVTPLPAQEVRRLGDARRRRRAAVGGVAAAVALVAAVAVPLALQDRSAPAGPATGETETGTPPPSPDQGWRTTIVEGTTLEPSVAGFEDRFEWVVAEDGAGVGTIDLCGEPAFPLDGVLDRLAADSEPTGENTDSAGRELRLYADDAAAEAAMQRVRDAVANCPQETHGDVTWLNQEPTMPDYPGDSIVGVGRTYETDGATAPGLDLWQLIRVGNAIAGIHVHSEHGDLTAGYDLSGDTPPLTAIVEAMCVYSADGCPGPTHAPSEGSGYEQGSRVIPDGFPIDRYLPTGDDTLAIDPNEGDDGIELCGEWVWPAGAVETRAAMTIGPEGSETRWLGAFDDPEQARAVLDAARTVLAGCHVTGAYDSLAVIPLDVDTGQDDVTFAVVSADGQPGGEIVQLMRVGSAVLVSSSGGEYTEASAPGVADELTAQSTDLAIEMCVFTSDGC